MKKKVLIIGGVLALLAALLISAGVYGRPEEKDVPLDQGSSIIVEQPSQGEQPNPMSLILFAIPDKK